MYIPRTIVNRIKEKLFTGKVIVLIGARQVGKSTSFSRLNQELGLNALILNCDEPEVRTLLESPSSAEIELLIGKHNAVIIDEAQRVKDIGLTLKRIYESHKDVQLLVTGSSSLMLHDQINEPLTGRKYEYFLYPIASQEIIESDGGLLWEKQLLEPRLIYGSYPEVLTSLNNAKELLINLADSYLYKDILSLENIKRPELLNKLLIALALQVSSEVSYNEIAKTIGTDSKTVEKYISLLEQCHVVFRLGALSRNIRNELSKSKKIYFYDNGIRNAVIQNFAPLSLRQDAGALWENFFISERIKFNHYRGHHANVYFWRTTAQQEIDYIEECDGQFTLFEIKWNPKAKVHFPKNFLETYNVSQSIVVTPENYLDYLIPQTK